MPMPDKYPVELAESHFAHNPTKTEIIEKYWYEFLRSQKAELDRRKTSGWGVQQVDLTEEVFWKWFIENKLEAGDAALQT